VAQSLKRVEVHAFEPVPFAVGLEQGGTAAALDADGHG
jgi:hypothetical protein